MIEYIQYCLSFVLFCFIIFFVFSGLTHMAQQISTMIPGNTCVSPGKTQKEQRNSIKMANLQDRIRIMPLRTLKLRLAAVWCLDETKTPLADDLIVSKLFMADWQVSTCGIKFCPKATLPLSTQVVAYLVVLFLTGLYLKILLMAMSQ